MPSGEHKKSCWRWGGGARAGDRDLGITHIVRAVEASGLPSEKWRPIPEKQTFQAANRGNRGTVGGKERSSRRTQCLERQEKKVSRRKRQSKIAKSAERSNRGTEGKPLITGYSLRKALLAEQKPNTRGWL